MTDKHPPLPQSGGSYRQNAQGGLDLIENTKPTDTRAERAAAAKPTDTRAERAAAANPAAPAAQNEE
ncbi:MAG: hypothetical protein H6R10_703 [Rhodocyclaceae bacterium]|nr:hypothetical protein [Rhodocyclaceae bacterium]